MIRRALARRLRQERGAVLVITSLVTVATLGATALAVDIGRGVALKRDLQGDADLAAIDAARALGSKKGQGGMAPQVHAEQLADESLERNGFDTDATGNSYTVVLGVVDPVSRVFTPTDVSLAIAVKVTLTTPIDWAFQPGGRSYTASGIADAGSPNNICEGDCDGDGDDDDEAEHALAGIAVGSFLARVDTSGGLLKSVFGKFLNGNVTLVGYTGIAAGSVTLGQLQAQLGFGTVDALLTTEVTVRNFLLAMVTVLQNKGDAPSIQAATDLANLALAADSNLDMRLGDVIEVAQGAEGSAATAELNAFQLAMMAAQLGNGENAVDISLTNQNVGGGLAGVLNLLGPNSLRLKVIEPMKIAFGPAGQDAGGQWLTRVETAQVRVQINLRPLGTVLYPLLNLPIYVEAASAEASLRSITCREPLDSSAVTVHADSQAVKANVGQVADINASGSVTVNDATILDLLLTDVKGRAQVNLASSGGNLSFDGPFDWSNTQTMGSTTLDLGDLLKPPALSLWIAGLPLGGLTTLVASLLNPVLSAADDGLIDPLLANLGVSLGGGDVTAWSLDCRPPHLVG
jgi:tight adherence protein G